MGQLAPPSQNPALSPPSASTLTSTLTSSSAINPPSNHTTTTASTTLSPTATTSTTTCSTLPPPSPVDQYYRPGYPGFSTCLNSDPDLLVFRRFGTLNVRNVLYTQDRLSELEERLRIIDEQSVYTDTRRFDRDTQRGEVMGEISKALVVYETALRTHASLISYEPPTKRQIKNLTKYKDDYNPLVSEELTFLEPENESDLITLAKNSEKSPLLRGIENAARLQMIFATNHDKNKNAKNDIEMNISSTTSIPHATDPPPNMQYYDSDLVNRTYRILVLLACWSFLVVPVVVLFFQKEQENKLITVIVCMVVTSTGLAVLTNAKDWEMFAATAAYGALLLVFFQLGGNGN